MFPIRNEEVRNLQDRRDCPLPQLLLKAIYLGYFTFGFWETWQVSQPKVKVCLEAWRSMGNGQFIYPVLSGSTLHFILKNVYPSFPLQNLHISSKQANK